jgi:anti-sigma regulatory factor (Ser/Thr protein kinase)
VKKNVLDICQYGFTEMLNNAIDHSASRKCVISYSQNAARIDIFVIDFGIGIFEKIQRDFDLPDPRSALLELSKGRLTSAPERHAGEGIFYTSRMFDTFSIGSGHLFYERTRRDDDDWLIEISQRENFTAGTSVKMRISTATDLTQQTVFDQYHADGMRFRKTHVPVSLARYDNEQLVSRSQAKRVLARFENFSEVMLDFNGVDQIGQPFADEIFRVFALSHPGTPIVAVRANDSIKRVIEGVRAAALAQRPGEAQDEET